MAMTSNTLKDQLRPCSGAFSRKLSGLLCGFALSFSGCVDPLVDAVNFQNPPIDDATGNQPLVDAAMNQMRLDSGQVDPPDALIQSCPGEGELCMTGLPGRCGVGQKVCDGQNAICMPTHEASSETCNGVDDDCDRKTDETFPEAETECEVGAGLPCAGRQGLRDCQNGALVCLPTAQDEICNGRDDDCDGAVDEGTVCGQYIMDHCKLWIARSSFDNLDEDDATPYWYETCPRVPSVLYGAVTCNSTNHSANFNLINLNTPPLGEDNNLGVALTCSDDGADHIADSVQRYCQFFLGHRPESGAEGMGQQRLQSWGPCPNRLGEDENGVRCTGTGGDGLFHAMALEENLAGGQGFGVAWQCAIPENEDWSEILTEAVEIYFGVSKGERPVFPPDNEAEVDGAPYEGFASAWSQCPAVSRDNNGNARCVSTHGDGHFHQIGLPPGNLSIAAMLSIRMTPAVAEDNSP